MPEACLFLSELKEENRGINEKQEGSKENTKK